MSASGMVVAGAARSTGEGGAYAAAPRLARAQLGLIALITIFCRLPSFGRALFDDDEAQYAAIARLMHAGGRLYADGGVDFKPPGIYWTYRAVFAVFGPGAMTAVHLVALLVVLATAWILAAIATRLAGPRAGLYAGVSYGVFTTVYYPKMLAANTEIFMMLALALAVWLVLAARCSAWALRTTFAAGAAVALACAWKQSAVLNLMVVAAAVVATRGWRRRLLAALAGFVAMLGLGLVAVWLTSSPADMWHWCVTRLLGSYRSSAWSGSLVHNFAVGFLPFVASSLLLWLAGASASLRAHAARAGERVVWIWFAIGLVSSFAGGHFFGHYFIQPVAALCVLAAIEIDRRLAASARPRRLALLVGTLTAVPALGFFVFNLVFEPLTERFGRASPDLALPCDWVRTHTAADERVFVWGMFPTLYVLADRTPASRFVGFMRGSERHRNVPPETAWDMGPEVWPALAADFAAHPPAIIVDTSTTDAYDFEHYPMRRFPVLAALVARDYRPLAVVGGVTMYGRTRP